MRARILNEQELERRETAAKIRTAARHGKSPAEIAELHQLPQLAVERILAPVIHARISDPVQLLRERGTTLDTAPAGIQMYWLGFLTAAGHIFGQGNSLALVVTLGDKPRTYIEDFMADMSIDHIYCEFCESSTLGLQVYLRDRDLCKALFPWGISSALHGDDSTLLDDLPKEFAIPFICGYMDGAQRRVGAKGFTVHGAPVVLARLNVMVQKYWGVSGGTVTSLPAGAELRFADPTARREIESQINAGAARLHA
jgi:hypothetical protein